MNLVVLRGNVGQDPETRYMPNGNAVTNVSVATQKRWRDKDSGDQKEATEWHRVVYFNKLAEIIGEHVKKGDSLAITGELRTRSYDKEGQKHYSTEIVGQTFEFAGSKPSGGTQQKSQPAAAPQDKREDFDDDILF
jgi:single-strand DNA-binding protein